MNKKRSLLTHEERLQIYDLMQEGNSLNAISKILNRSKCCITSEVRNNGGRENYDPDKAQERRYKIAFEANQKIKEKAKNYINPYHTMSDRIQNLEFQVEIILDMIKEIKQQMENDCDKEDKGI